MRSLTTLLLVFALGAAQMTAGCRSTSKIRTTYGKTYEGRITGATGLSVTIGSQRLLRSNIKSISYPGTAPRVLGMTFTLVGVGSGLLLLGGGFVDMVAFLYTGVPLLAVGIPLWVVGSGAGSEQRRIVNDAKSLGGYQTPSLPGTYNLTLRF